MRFAYILLGIFFTLAVDSIAQELKTKNIIVITLDGYRWKELFEGADPAVVQNRKYVSDKASITRFTNGSKIERRESLMPFMWRAVAKQGQLYGNRNFKNKVNCVNNHLLSYPGYSEMFVGYPQREVSSNDKDVNPNPTVLEYLHQHHDFHDEIAAFTTWDVFPYILREEKSEIYVNSGNEMAVGDLSAKERSINDALALSQRDDNVTFQFAFEYLKRKQPRVMFIGFDGTDYHGHGGRYDEYLKSAHQIDSMLNDLWGWIQSTPGYKNETTIFITTDHGRGNGKHNWKDHRLVAPGSRHIWFAVMGPDTPAFGEMKFKGKYFQKQVAKTLAAFLGFDYRPKEKPGDVVQTMIAVPEPASTPVILGRSSSDEK